MIMQKSKTQVAPRYPTREVAGVEIYGRTGRLTVRMRNLSASGARLEIIRGETTPQTGDILKITIQLKEVGRTHKIDGEVVWLGKGALGVQFIKKEDVALRILSKLSS